MGVLVPLAEQFGFGGVAGFVVGYAAKKATKAAAILLGLLFILLQFLAYKHLITLHWGAVGEAANRAVETGAPQSAAQKFMAILTHNLPFGSAFAVGFLLGFKKG